VQIAAISELLDRLLGRPQIIIEATHTSVSVAELYKNAMIRAGQAFKWSRCTGKDGKARKPPPKIHGTSSPTFGRAKGPARLYQKTLAKTGNASRCAAGISEDAFSRALFDTGRDMTSEAVRLRKARYRRSAKGKAAAGRYKRSAKGKAANARYRQSEKGKAANAKARARYKERSAHRP
jgi:hypothetical protein